MANISMIEVLADLRVARAAAAGRTIAEELLDSCRAVDFARVHIALRIHTYHMRPVEFSGLTAARRKTTHFCKFWRLITYTYHWSDRRRIYNTALRRLRSSPYPRCRRSLRSNVDLTNKTTFAYFGIWVGAGLAHIRCLKNLNTIITAIADIQETVVGQLGAVQRTAEEHRLHIAAL